MSPSSRIDVSMHGRDILLKRDLLKSDDHHFEFPSLGHFKWKPDSWGGSSLKLYNVARRLIAKCKGKSPQSGQIEIFVQRSEQLVDLVAVTRLAMQLFTARDNKKDDMIFKTLDKQSVRRVLVYSLTCSSMCRQAMPACIFRTTRLFNHQQPKD